LRYLAPIRTGGAHVIDRKNLEHIAAARVRYHQVLEAGLLEKNRLSRLREEIHNRRASQFEGVFGNAELERLLPVAAFEGRDEEDDLRAVGKGLRSQRFQVLQFGEEEFFRKREVFLQDSVAGE